MLRIKNFERAEPQMQAAAASVGARLLPLMAQELHLLHCPSGEMNGIAQPIVLQGGESGCITWQAQDGSAFRFLDNDGHAKLGITVRPEVSHFTRLARHGNTIHLLDPDVSRRPVREATQCECNAGPRMRPDPQFFAFVIDDIPQFELRKLRVPMQEDVVEWKCKAYLV
jgi:hypothetical protein